MRHAAHALVWLFAAGCTVGAPAGFSSGDRWTFPLVGPLEDGLLVTPAMVHGHGPYLFAIDPDANVTEIDKQIVDDAGLRMGSGPHLIDETDTGRIRFYAELLDLRVADLAVERRDAMVFPSGFYDVDGRHIQGILGRDVIADSLVFGFDRDQGIATLATVHAFKPPPQVIALHYETISGNAVGLPPEVERKYDPDPRRLPLEVVSAGGATPTDMTPVPRRLTTAQIGGSTFAMHLDLGARTSQLAQTRWPSARLSPSDARVRVVDEAATAREMHSAAVAEVTVGGNRGEVTFTPYVEKRFGDKVDGALGLDFFRPYAVYASWDSKTYFLKVRGDAAATTTARLGRWGAAIPACPHTGCVALELAAGDGGPMLDVMRDAEARGRSLEVFVGVTPAAGRAATSLVVELPIGVDRTTAVLPADYAGATLAVLDVSPFLRACPEGSTGCVLRSAASAH